MADMLLIGLLYVWLSILVQGFMEFDSILDPFDSGLTFALGVTSYRRNGDVGAELHIRVGIGSRVGSNSYLNRVIKAAIHTSCTSGKYCT